MIEAARERMEWPEVVLRQAVISSVPGSTGSWLMERRIRLPRIPVAGDWIMWDNDWASEYVKDVTLGSPCYVNLHPCKTDSPAILANHEQMTALGWKQTGGPSL